MVTHCLVLCFEFVIGAETCHMYASHSNELLFHFDMASDVKFGTLKTYYVKP
jgi:hypothetical protein